MNIIYHYFHFLLQHSLIEAPQSVIETDASTLSTLWYLSISIFFIFHLLTFDKLFRSWYNIGIALLYYCIHISIGMVIYTISALLLSYHGVLIDAIVWFLFRLVTTIRHFGDNKHNAGVFGLYDWFVYKSTTYNEYHKKLNDETLIYNSIHKNYE